MALVYPVAWLVLWVAAELAGLLLGRRLALFRSAGVRCVYWALRPLGVAAVLHLVYRLNPEQAFTNVLGYPYYARPWQAEFSPFALLAEAVRSPVIRFWSLTSVVVFLAIFALAVFAMRGGCRTRGRRAGFLGLLFLLTVALHLALACVPGGASRPMERFDSFLRPWFNSGATFLYALEHVDTPRRFMRNFVARQPALRRSMSGLSHPPGGTLSLYAIGQVMRVEGVRRHDRLKYAVGVTLFSALNVFAVYFLAASVFGSARTGCLAACFWSCLPLSTLYNTWAQNGVFLVFFTLALGLMWTAVVPERRSPWSLLLLGVVFHFLTLLTYAWMIATAIFAVFVVAHGWRRGRGLREIAWRGVPPLAVMTVLTAATLAYYRLDYLAMYRNASYYVSLFYRIEGATAWFMGLAGGQLALFLGLGPLLLSAFFAALWVAGRSGRGWGDRELFLASMAGIYLLPMFFYHRLNIEAPRVWNWMAMLPLVFAVHHLAEERRRPALVGIALAGTFAASFLMKLFYDFAP